MGFAIANLAKNQDDAFRIIEFCLTGLEDITEQKSNNKCDGSEDYDLVSHLLGNLIGLRGRARGPGSWLKQLKQRLSTITTIKIGAFKTLKRPGVSKISE